MKVLVIGSGSREHALAWKIRRDNPNDEIFAIPGNAGIAALAECYSGFIFNTAEGINNFVTFAKEKKVDLTIVGPEIPLSLGIADKFGKEGLKIFGANKKAAQLESSKPLAKMFMQKYGIPTAPFEIFDLSKMKDISRHLGRASYPLVIKRAGLCAGKGVMICRECGEANAFIKACRNYGDSQIIVEDFISGGEELSFIVFTDGESIRPLPFARDYKFALDGNQGLLTGGMGVISPAQVSEELYDKIINKIVNPTLEGLRKEEIVYKGIIYFGLMIENGEPYLLEYNARFGDPETPGQIPRLKTNLLYIIQKVLDSKLHEVKREWSEEAAAGVVLASEGYPGKCKIGFPINGLEEAALNHPDVMVFHAGTAFEDIKKGAVVTNGGRVLTVTALGKDIPDAANKCYKAIGENGISFPGMHYRKDIGI